MDIQFFQCSLSQLYQFVCSLINELNKILDSGSLYNYMRDTFFTFSQLFSDRMHTLSGHDCDTVVKIIMEKAMT